MRKSSERHPLAVLRRIIGMTQPEFAELVGISLSSLTKIESLKIPLTFENAMLIESETGCCALWLLDGDAKATPTAAIMMPDQRKELEKSEASPLPDFDLHTFQWVRSRKAAGLPVEEIDYDYPDHVTASNILSILLACHKAKRRGNDKYARALIHTLSTQFCRELGQSEITDEGAPEYVSEQLNTIHFLSQMGQPRK